ncbi:hypothetical protein KAH37_04870 [bacterium]|nr:hypothetical protein [bacterium]
MKKIIVMLMVSLFTFMMFADDLEKKSNDVLQYLNDNKIEYEMMLDQAVKELPEDAQVYFIKDVEAFLGNKPEVFLGQAGVSTKSMVTIESRAYSLFYEPHSRRIGVRGDAYMPSGSDGYQYKWDQRYDTVTGYWYNITRDRHCPGGSSSAYVTSCEESNENKVFHYCDADETIACTTCDDGDAYAIRFNVRSYAITWIFNGWFWAPVKMYGLWTSTFTSGNKYNYSPTGDMCWQFLSTDCDQLMAW